jgi:hypothetical protein
MLESNVHAAVVTCGECGAGERVAWGGGDGPVAGDGGAQHDVRRHDGDRWRAHGYVSILPATAVVLSMRCNNRCVQQARRGL